MSETKPEPEAESLMERMLRFREERLAKEAREAAERLAKKEEQPKAETNGKVYTDSGILFRNRAKKEPKHPDYKGDLTVQCENCGVESKRDLAAWIREARNGTKFVTLSFRLKDGGTTHTQADTNTGADEDIPF